MASLLEHVMVNKLSSELKDAINTVGGDASSATGPMDYPQIIIDQLTAKQASTDGSTLYAGDGITINQNGDGFIISANSNATLANSITLPHNIDNDVKVDTISAGTSIQRTLEIICNDVIPTIPSVLSGDIIKASENGTDQYQHPYFDDIGVKSGLVPERYYIRMFIASQQEPVYIEMIGEIGDVVIESLTKVEAEKMFDDIFEIND